MGTRKKKGAAAPAELHIQSLEELDAVMPRGDAAAQAMLRRMVLGASTPETLTTLGQGYRTEDILAAVPLVLAQVHQQITRLKKKGAALPEGYSEDLGRLVLAETLALRGLNVAYEEQLRATSGVALNRRAALKTANSHGMHLRRSVARKLERMVLAAGSSARAELERAAAASSGPASTVASLRAVAKVLDDTRRTASAEQRRTMDGLGLSDARSAALRAQADEILRLSDAGAGPMPVQAVDQRALDQQDGLVLTLLRELYLTFRDAEDEGLDVARIKLGPKLERFVSRPGGEAEDEDEEGGDTDTDEPRPEES